MIINVRSISNSRAVEDDAAKAFLHAQGCRIFRGQLGKTSRTNQAEQLLSKDIAFPSHGMKRVGGMRGGLQALTVRR